MKKGMTVELENGLRFTLADSVTYNNEKYFAAVSDDETDEQLYFFKLISNDEEETLELIDLENNENVINALIEHIKNTF